MMNLLSENDANRLAMAKKELRRAKNQATAQKSREKQNDDIRNLEKAVFSITPQGGGWKSVQLPNLDQNLVYNSNSRFEPAVFIIY
jgi:hypothetical protein